MGSLPDNPIRALPTDGLEGGQSWLREQLDNGDTDAVFAVAFTKDDGMAFTLRGNIKAKDLYWVRRLIDQLLVQPPEIDP